MTNKVDYYMSLVIINIVESSNYLRTEYYYIKSILAASFSQTQATTVATDTSLQNEKKANYIIYY